PTVIRPVIPPVIPPVTPPSPPTPTYVPIVTQTCHYTWAKGNICTSTVTYVLKATPPATQPVIPPIDSTTPPTNSTTPPTNSTTPPETPPVLPSPPAPPTPPVTPPTNSTTPLPVTTGTNTTQAILTVNSVDLSGNSIAGLWTTLESGSTVLTTGYTPITYTVNTGSQYNVTLANYNNYVFDHWEDGTTNSNRTITPTQSATLTAYYNTVSTATAPQPPT